MQKVFAPAPSRVVLVRSASSCLVLFFFFLLQLGMEMHVSRSGGDLPSANGCGDLLFRQLVSRKAASPQLSCCPPFFFFPGTRRADALIIRRPEKRVPAPWGQGLGLQPKFFVT